MVNRKDAVREYKETPRPAGVYRVVHRSSGRTLLATSPDVPARINRIRAELSLGSHPNKQLQSDWVADGEEGFTFEILDSLEASDDPETDMKGDLGTLLELWRENLSIEPVLRY